MTDIFILSAIGALGLLYGVSRVLSNNPRNQTRSNPRNQTRSNPRNQTRGEPRNQTRSKPRNQTRSNPRNQIRSKPRIEPPNQTRSKPRSAPISNLTSKIIFTKGELELEDIEYYNPEIIVIDNPKKLELDYESMVEKTIQIYWTNYSKVKTYSDAYCYGIQLKKDKPLHIIVVRSHELYGDNRLLLSVSLGKCLKGLDIKDNEEVMIMGLKSKNNMFYIGNHPNPFYLKGNIYSNRHLKSVNMDSNDTTMINYTLDDYIMFDKEWVIPQKKYIDLVKKFNTIGSHITYDRRSGLDRMDGYGLKIDNIYIHIQQGRKKWTMVKISDILQLNEKTPSKQVLVEENKTYSIQTDYTGTIYNLPRI